MSICLKVPPRKNQTMTLNSPIPHLYREKSHFPFPITAKNTLSRHFKYKTTTHFPLPKCGLGNRAILAVEIREGVQHTPLFTANGCISHFPIEYIVNRVGNAIFSFINIVFTNSCVKKGKKVWEMGGKCPFLKDGSLENG